MVIQGEELHVDGFTPQGFTGSLSTQVYKLVVGNLVLGVGEPCNWPVSHSDLEGGWGGWKYSCIAIETGISSGCLSHCPDVDLFCLWPNGWLSMQHQQQQQQQQQQSFLYTRFVCKRMKYIKLDIYINPAYILWVNLRCTDYTPRFPLPGKIVTITAYISTTCNTTTRCGLIPNHWYLLLYFSIAMLRVVSISLRTDYTQRLLLTHLRVAFSFYFRTRPSATKQLNWRVLFSPRGLFYV